MEEEKAQCSQDETSAVDSSLQEDCEQDSNNTNATEQSLDEDYKQKYEELKDQYTRVYADFENVKKRLEREKYQSLEYANESFGKDLLPVVDTLQKALESAKASENGEAITQGLELTLESFYKALSKHGIEAIAADSEFDPNLHECLMQVPLQGKENGQIAQVLQHGFTYKGRTLRPAMVSIVKND